MLLNNVFLFKIIYIGFDFAKTTFFKFFFNYYKNDFNKLKKKFFKKYDLQRK